MFQYRPGYRAYEYPEISRSLVDGEIQKALDIVRDSGLEDILI
jgi:uncharacterized Fe-S radical SAM superfamily protein PflX